MSTTDANDPVTRLHVPPHSLEAEQSVLGGLMLDNAAWDRAGDLLVEGDFYRHEHRVIYAAVASLIAACKEADVLTVYEWLKAAGKAEAAGGLVYLNALAQSVPSAANVRRYAEIVRERALLRQLAAAADRIATSAFNPQGRSATEILDAAASVLGELERRGSPRTPRSLEQVVMDRLGHIQELAEGTKEAGWPTQIPWLDRVLNGGLRPGRVYCIAARPSIGKTSLALSFGLGLAGRDLTTLVLSQEMPDGEIGDRALSHLGRVDYGELQTGELSDDGWSRLTDAVERARGLPVYIDDQPALTLADIRIKARSVRGLKVLIVDYLQLCSGGGKGDTRNSEIEEITRGLKALAKQLDVAVVLLSQLNREVEKRANKRPCLADLRDSGAIEQDMDVVMFLWPVRELGNRRIIGLEVAKNRQGKRGEVGLDFEGSVQRWGESTADIRTSRSEPQGGYE
jgi:replicative DNA helicase